MNVNPPDTQPSGLPVSPWTRWLQRIAQKLRSMHVGAQVLCNVNETRALIGLCLLVTSHWDKVRDQVFIIAHMIIGLSQPISIALFI